MVSIITVCVIVYWLIGVVLTFLERVVNSGHGRRYWEYIVNPFIYPAFLLIASIRRWIIHK